MNIVLFSDTFPPQVNGVANVVASSAEALAERGHDVHVFTAFGEKREAFEQVAKEKYTVHNIPSLPFWGYPDLRAAIPFAPVRRALGDWRPDVVHTHTLFGVGYLAVRAARYFKVPLIGTHHTFLNHYLKYVRTDFPGARKLTWRYTIGYYNRCDLLISPSRVLASELVGNGFRGKIEVLPNSVDVNYFVPGEVAPPRSACVYVGRLSYEKSVDQVLLAFREVVRRHPEAKLTIVGDGPERKNLEHLCRELALHENVQFTGFFRGERLREALQENSIFLTASETENMPLSLLEAMAVGLPVVGVAAKGIPEIVQDKMNGRLTTPGVPIEMAEAVSQLLNDQAMYEQYARAARAEALQYSVQSVTDKLETIYANVIGTDERKRTS